jgi:hypothetical protein
MLRPYSLFFGSSRNRVGRFSNEKAENSGDIILISHNARLSGRPALRITRSRLVNRSIISINCSLPAGRPVGSNVV